MSIAALLMAFAPVASAAEPAPADPLDFRYLLGLDLESSAEYEGSDRRTVGAHLLWAYERGRVRISTSGAASLLGFAKEPVGAGISAELFSTDRWSLAASLRMDNGRKSADSPHLAGLPDIRRTLRARLVTTYMLDDEWNLSASFSQDILGREGGSELGLNAAFRHWISDRTSVSAGVGVSFGDGQLMRTRFGVPDSHAAGAGLAPFTPRAGAKSAHVGVGLTTALTTHWIASVSAEASTLLGDAADSPLTRQATSLTANFTVGYRCCR